jgi:nucleotide-binding universal stress UspA family protein
MSDPMQSIPLNSASPPPDAAWMPTTLTVPCDGLTANHRSLDIAAAIAAQLDLPIRVRSLVDSAQVLPARQRALRHLTDSISADLNITTTIDIGHDASAFVLDEISDPSTTVVLSGGTSAKAIPGSLTHEVLRFATAPVMFTGPFCLDWSGPIRRILVPIDGSRLAERCFPTAALWAEATTSPVEFISVVHPNAHNADALVTHDVIESGFAASTAHTFRDHYGIQTLADVAHEKESHRAEAIIRCALDQPGTIICLSSNGSSHNPHTLATTTTRLVHLSPVPVIVVRS